MIHVLAMIDLKEGTREQFLQEFHGIVTEVRAEVGCIEYGPTIDVDTGNEKIQAPRENAVTIVEKWESLDALSAHLVAPHMLAYRERVKDIVNGSTVYVTEPA
ncbi:MAG: antibiotic biosynthesis monooxygenase [Gemmatimonadetes bacterium]|jgi:quinol monooxygenase YgiN|nr:antibiotic biosynthesis monooxygenase [Gemmatimonadota bacterium]MBT6144110.1 antibiotic biosynthesis monooxygenase [Gemmatimonadota bacterium]MBT7859481.1 antibiotic biosynthesis monooxygenase [Gemmatimonadota bacterium]